MRLKINHQTEYRYSEPQRLIVQSHRMYPSDCNTQKILDWRVECDDAHFGQYFHDGAGNCIRTMTLNKKVDSVVVSIQGEIETNDANGVVKLNREYFVPQAYLNPTTITLADSAMTLELKKAFVDTDDNSLDRAHALTQWVNTKVEYVPGATDHSSTAAQAWRLGKGVCQDHAHCLCAIARLLGIPARYVTGYILTDASGEAHHASHAWAELFIENLGWVGFDATNRCCIDERYVRISSGLDALDAAFIRGIARGVGQESMTTSVTIDQIQQ